MSQGPDQVETADALRDLTTPQLALAGYSFTVRRPAADRSIAIGQEIRYPRMSEVGHEPAIIDSMVNWWWLTATSDAPQMPAPKMDSGISCPASSSIADGRTPFVLLRSSPHKSGSATTPWDDVISPDDGFAHYFGDNRPGLQRAAHDAPGNARLLRSFALQQSTDESERQLAPPLLVFQGFQWSGRAKGQIRFQGLGVIARARLVVQQDSRSHHNFTNYLFELVLLDIGEDDDRLDWRWLDARRSPTATAEEANTIAPTAWRRWIRLGSSSLERLQRRVVKRQIVSPREQKPEQSSELDRILREVLAFYEGRKHRFEALADFVVGEVFRSQGVTYRSGWITRGTGDSGIDFVGAIDLDPTGGFPSTRVVLLGQAKCEERGSGTSAVHIARLVARLRRGWFGAYVTTSFFSQKVQEEILVDRYPVVLVHGLRLASTLRRALLTSGQSLSALLREIDGGYEARVGWGNPDLMLGDFY